MSNHTHQIYDRIIKKILSLSSKAVINLINGLYETNHSPDSTLTYNWTEHVEDDLNRTLADTILTIDGIYQYHIEAQTTKDGNIVFRVFDYSYHHAVKHVGNANTLRFPTPKIIYLCDNSTIPDQEEIVLDFGSQGIFKYQVTTFKLLELSIQELDKRHMIILIPFLILQLRKKISNDRSEESIRQLQFFILHDIIEAINKNVNAGNLTEYDALRLQELTCKLYRHVYAHYEELQKGGVNAMVENSLILEVDIWEQKLRQKEEEKQQALILQTDVWEQKLKQKELEKEQALILQTDVWEQKLKQKEQEKQQALILQTDAWEQKLKQKELEKEQEKQQALILQTDAWEQKLKQKELEKEQEKQQALILQTDAWEQKLKQKEQEKQQALSLLEKDHVCSLYQELNNVKKVAKVFNLSVEQVENYLSHA